MLSEEKTCEKMINNKEMLVGVLYDIGVKSLSIAP
ncbi:hypothetical protein BN3660_00135 [Eubacteriaceae bacterium CHKCI004]|nr:hypothetical protein BN3660_00135 [Eubacteriaceae bacterium CHKCI004]